MVLICIHSETPGLLSSNWNPRQLDVSCGLPLKRSTLPSYLEWVATIKQLSSSIVRCFLLIIFVSETIKPEPAQRPLLHITAQNSIRIDNVILCTIINKGIFTLTSASQQ